MAKQTNFWQKYKYVDKHTEIYTSGYVIQENMSGYVHAAGGKNEWNYPFVCHQSKITTFSRKESQQSNEDHL